MFRGLGWYRVKRVQASFDSCLFMPMAGGPKSLNGRGVSERFVHRSILWNLESGLAERGRKFRVSCLCL